MITGYFLYHPDEAVMRQRIGKSIKKVLPIIAILQLIYYPFAPITQSISEGWLLYFRLIFLGFHSFKTIHLWYLTALVEGLIFLYLYLRFFRGATLIYLVPLALTHLILGRFNYLLGISSDLFVFNFLTYAIPFLSLGAWIKGNESSILSRKHWLDYTILMLILSHIDHLTLKSFILLAPFALGIFVCMLSNKDLGKDSYLATIGEKYAGNIYYFHLIVAYSLIPMLEHWRWESYYQDFGTFIVFAASLLVALLVVRLQDRLGWNLLR